MYQFNVVLEARQPYKESTYWFESNHSPDRIFAIIHQIDYKAKFWEDDLNIQPKHRDWFRVLKDQNPWFASTEAENLIMGDGDGLNDEYDYIEFTFQTVKAFIPDLVWRKLGASPEIPWVTFGGSQRMTNWT